MEKIAYATVIVALLTVMAPAASAQSGGGFGDGSGGSGGGIGGSQPVGEQRTAADAVYVRENGDAVLVYEGSDGGSSDASLSYGADMSSGLAYLLSNGTVEDTGFSGNMSFVAEPASLLANGSFETDQVEAVEDLSLDASGETNQTNSVLSAELDSTLSSQFAALVSAASTEGELVSGPDSLTSSGSVSYRTALGGSSTREVRRYDLTGTEGGYSLDARERRKARGELTPVSGPGGNRTLESTEPVEIWGTREKARDRLRERYAGFAENVSGNVSLTLESYSFENVTAQSGFGTTRNESLIDVEYTVEYTGVKEGLADAIVDDFPGNVSEDVAEDLAQGIRDMNLNRLRFASVSGAGETELNWTVDVENYNDAALAYFRLSSEMSAGAGAGMGPGPGAGPGPGVGTSAPSSPFASQEFVDEAINRSRKQMEAAEAAGFVSRWEWSGSMESESGSGSGLGPGMGPGAGPGSGGSGPTASLDAELTHTTENWEAYVNELESRDAPTPVDTSFDVQVSSADGGLEGDMRWEAGGESLYQGYSETMSAYEEILNASEDTDADFVRHLGNSGFRIAKMDASVGGDGWRIEGGAAFNNGTALSSAIEATEGINVTEVVGEQEDGVVKSYVKVDGFVDETTEEAVRSREQVDDETTVNLPGEWDREFPEADTEAAAAYLGVSAGDGGGSSALPGFGFVAAVVSLLVVAVAVGRRRRRESEDDG